MIFISHRGNINGIIKKRENTISYIKEALSAGFNVEVDIWYKKNSFYLGHDYPKIKVNTKFLKNKKIWCHAKNFEAVEMSKKKKLHFFWHENDDYTLTSKGIVWTYPGKKLFENSINLMPENQKRKINFKNKYLGICSDYIQQYKNMYKKNDNKKN